MTVRVLRSSTSTAQAPLPRFSPSLSDQPDGTLETVTETGPPFAAAGLLSARLIGEPAVPAGPGLPFERVKLVGTRFEAVKFERTISKIDPLVCAFALLVGLANISVAVPFCSQAMLLAAILVPLEIGSEPWIDVMLPLPSPLKLTTSLDAKFAIVS